MKVMISEAEWFGYDMGYVEDPFFSLTCTVREVDAELFKKWNRIKEEFEEMQKEITKIMKEGEAIDERL